jgi:hypothetical protein
MIDPTNDHGRDDVVAWNEDGGAAPSGVRQQTDLSRPAAGAGDSERQRLDDSHESDGRGEHRDPDAHQTAAERQSRQERDDLERGLARRRPGPDTRE